MCLYELFTYLWNWWTRGCTSVQNLKPESKDSAKSLLSLPGLWPLSFMCKSRGSRAPTQPHRAFLSACPNSPSGLLPFPSSSVELAWQLRWCLPSAHLWKVQERVAFQSAFSLSRCAHKGKRASVQHHFHCLLPERKSRGFTYCPGSRKKQTS